MGSNMSLTDKIRVNILDALIKKNSVIPNIRQIKRYTGYHKATIKSSLEFMQQQGLLEGFGPKIDLKKLGYNLEVIVLVQADLSRKDLLEKMVQITKQDPHVYRLSSVIGSGNWNLIVRQIYKDVESYHRWAQKTYYEVVPGIFDFVKDRQVFYETDPHYKTSSRTDAIISLIKREKGFE